jgi:CheY-like chemotaxis protein
VQFTRSALNCRPASTKGVVMIVIVTDLIFSTKITSTAAAVGAGVKVVHSMEKLNERLSSGTDRVAIVDLNVDGFDVNQAIRRIRSVSSLPRIIAFVSHVQADLIEAARAAGADEVMARSAFVNKLPALLAEAARLESSSSTIEGGRA